MTAPLAIFIVNGGVNPPFGHWLELCLRKIREHSRALDHHVYLWNNVLEDTYVRGLAATGAPGLTVLSYEPGTVLRHFHADPLQRLYELARARGHRYYITMDSDAHPISEAWLDRLLEPLAGDCALSGIWRDELSPAMPPYVHPACLATTFDFTERHGLQLNHMTREGGKPYDTMTAFTDAALERGEGIHKLVRSNARNLHRLIGGVYGDVVYHHGSGPRPRKLWFWGEPESDLIGRANAYVRNKAAAALFSDYDGYLGWLTGCHQRSGLFEKRLGIKGMDKAAVELLSGCLKRCGGRPRRSELPSVAVFRHPSDEALEPWLRYHEKLLALHARAPFPLVEYDPGDVGGFRETIAAVAITLGLTPDHQALTEFTSAAVTGAAAKTGRVPLQSRKILAQLKASRFSC